jgi:site-specific recombinase XerC
LQQSGGWRTKLQTPACSARSSLPEFAESKGQKQLGARIGNWLTQDQARLLLEKADGDDLRSVRDLATISVLIGCGLRRAELSALTVEDLQIRQGHWAIVDLVGKGGHVRTVPVPIWVKGAVDR